jgi:hypothetical protein
MDVLYGYRVDAGRIKCSATWKDPHTNEWFTGHVVVKATVDEVPPELTALAKIDPTKRRLTAEPRQRGIEAIQALMGRFLAANEVMENT